MNTANTPSPDELLKSIENEELQKKLGHLKIFFGMSAGVGKTYAMLEEAHRKLADGVDVIIGTINTHGRKETELLLQGLPIIPEKWISYRNTVFEELDLETILSTKPQLVLVDELAHSNVPGSRHPKRWQDVIEILDAGIDVYTTLNVQHLESRKDQIESLTGIHIRETVPDLVLERASSIEFIDIPPPELLKRLQEGKVYLGEQSIIAADNFFQEENLTALREMALRFTAEKVEHDLHGLKRGKGWKTRERLMVAISAAPSSEQLIRAARRLAFELDAVWYVVFVDNGTILKDDEQARLSRFFNLARDLGAEVITTHDLDVASAITRVADQRDITRIVIGHPPKRKFQFSNFFQENLIDRLINDNKHIDIIILRQDKLTHIYQRSIFTNQIASGWKAYAIIFGFGAVITLIGLLINPIIGYKSVGFIFLLGILILSLFVGRIPILIAALLSAIFWNQFFIPPLFHSKITDPDDITLVVIYFFVAAIMGTLTSRTQQQDRFLHKREELMERLYEIERDIAGASNIQYLRLNVSSHLEKYFPGQFEILIKGSSNQLLFENTLSQVKNEKEQATATWVLHNGKMGGWSTDTLPSAEGLYFPIKYSSSTIGVLAYFPKRERPLSLEEINFIQTITQQLGIYLERYLFEERLSSQDYTRQIERMHGSIFHSLNRSFYTPLDQIEQVAKQVEKSAQNEQTRLLTNQLEELIIKTKFTVNNIIALSEIESGYMHFEKKKHNLQKLIEDVLEIVKPITHNRTIIQQIPSEPFYFIFDFKLLKLAMTNLILNAVEHSSPYAPITIDFKNQNAMLRLSVIDQGPGIPNDILPLIFDKFYHQPESSKNLGLGLSVVRAVMALHQGKIEVSTNLETQAGKGTAFSLIFPIV